MQDSSKPDIAAEGQRAGKVKASLSEIVSAFSFALDLTEAAVHGHAIRTCLLGMKIAGCLELAEAENVSLYYALLLKDVGCSSNSAKMCELIGGDDRAMKHDVKLLDWTRPSPDAVAALWRNALPGAPAWRKAGRILRLGLTQQQNNAAMIGLRCDRGASIVRKIGLSDATAQAIRSLDEHWNGSGYPDRARGEAIPLLGRILAVAQHLDVFASEFGMDKAVEVLRERSGRWFDPELVRVAVALHGEGALRAELDAAEQHRRVMEIEPGEAITMSEDEVDRLCEAFADVVDAKSSFTYEHSLGVTRVAETISRALALPPATQKLLYRSALLHDLGKLNVPNSILDKPGKLSSEEWVVVRQHPQYTEEILSRISSFGEMAKIAGQHHERLDGSGYPYALAAKDLSLESRVVAVADVFGSLTETRPYRDDLPLEEAIAIMRSEAEGRLDAECVEALLSAL